MVLDNAFYLPSLSVMNVKGFLSLGFLFMHIKELQSTT